MKKQHSLSCPKYQSCALGRGCAVCVHPSAALEGASIYPRAQMLQSILAIAPPAPCSMAGPANSKNSVCRFAPHKLSTLPLFSHAAAASNSFATGTGFVCLLVYSSHKMFLHVPWSLLSDDTLNTVKQDTPWACSAHQLSSSKGMLRSFEVYWCSCARHTNACAEITQSLTDVVHTAFY